MNEKQQEHFKQILLDWREQLMQEVDRTVNHMQDDAANYPDPADRATQEEEFSLELRARDRERKLIKKIDGTLERISIDEPFVRRIERRDRNVENFEFPHGPVQAVGGDEDGNPGLERDFVLLDFQMSFSFQDIVNLGRFLMVVRTAVLGDFNHVHGGHLISILDERSFGLSARTWGWLDFGKIRN